jgi:hypothetical protein
MTENIVKIDTMIMQKILNEVEIGNMTPKEYSALVKEYYSSLAGIAGVVPQPVMQQPLFQKVWQQPPSQKGMPLDKLEQPLLFDVSPDLVVYKPRSRKKFVMNTSRIHMADPTGKHRASPLLMMVRRFTAKGVFNGWFLHAFKVEGNRTWMNITEDHPMLKKGEEPVEFRITHNQFSYSMEYLGGGSPRNYTELGIKKIAEKIKDLISAALDKVREKHPELMVRVSINKGGVNGK